MPSAQDVIPSAAQTSVCHQPDHPADDLLDAQVPAALLHHREPRRSSGRGRGEGGQVAGKGDPPEAPRRLHHHPSCHAPEHARLRLRRGSLPDLCGEEGAQPPNQIAP